MQILTSESEAQDEVVDCVFQTTSHMAPDVNYTQNLVWQDHSSRGNVGTAMGLLNTGGGTMWYMNTAGVDGYHTPNTPHTWQGAYSQGGTDNWEVQLKNTAASSGWLNLWRNGVLVDHYVGPNIVQNAYNVIGFGIYEFQWKGGNQSDLTDVNIDFNFFRMYQLPSNTPNTGIPPLSQSTFVANGDNLMLAALWR